MARILTEGFESGDILFFNGPLGSGAAVTTANLRPGSGSYAFTCGSSGNTYSYKVLPAAYNEFFFRVAFRKTTVNDNYDVVDFNIGGTIIAGIRFLNNRMVYYRGTTAVATGTIPTAVVPR